MVGAPTTWQETAPGPWHFFDAESPRLAIETLGWKNGAWRHNLAVVKHPDPIADDTCVLEITGDDAGLRDDEVSLGISMSARLPVVTLFNVPNQPVFDLREDALLAYSFLQSIGDGDREWAALVPMVRSVLAAMSAATELSEGQWTKFVLTGASKRGWTTWLATATGDPRIIAAAPRMFDNLRAADQMRKQVADWNGYSPLLEDYTAAGLQERATTGPAADLAAWLDPATYAREITVPVLIINGANDPFWCADASSVYVADLPEDAAFVACPDTKHVGPLPTFASRAFASICHAAATGTHWPAPRPTWDGNTWDVSQTGAFGHRLWTARSADGKFDTARWTVKDMATTPEPQDSCRTAHFMELLMPAIGTVGPYAVTSHVVVSPPVS